jgi:hypothetical protein
MSPEGISLYIDEHEAEIGKGERASDPSSNPVLASLQAQLTDARRLLDAVHADSGFRNLFEQLQDEIADYLNPSADQGDNHEQ